MIGCLDLFSGVHLTLEQIEIRFDDGSSFLVTLKDEARAGNDGIVMDDEIDRSSWESILDPAVITTEKIATGKSSVLWVVHDEGHGGWQLYDGEDVSNQRPFVLPKIDALRLDPTLSEITDLPVGWEAHRPQKEMEWTRNKR